MNDTTNKSTSEQLERAQMLLIMANLPPEKRLECEGIIALGLEAQVEELIKKLEELVSEKEAAYLEYKNSVKEAILESGQKIEE